MAYIGRGPVTGSFEKQDLTADGSTTTFTLNYNIAIVTGKLHVF